jgi:uncharacterized YigZ family protein
VGYRTIGDSSEHSEFIKGSRFRARVQPLSDPGEVEAFILKLRSEEPDANHVAWAWRFGAAMRFSDDGEPGGTAGRPMLEVLLKRDIDRVIALVARVFGGVRLGAGGLVRAYGGSVAKALDGATLLEVADRVRFQVHAPFADADALMRLLQAPRVELLPPTFDGNGVVLSGSVLASETAELERRIGETSRGRACYRTCERDPY